MGPPPTPTPALKTTAPPRLAATAATLAPHANPITSPEPATTDHAANPLAGTGQWTHRTRPRKIDFRQPERLDAAKHAIGELPAPGEIIHAIQGGDFFFWDLVPMIAAAIAPARIERLTLATLSFNYRHGRQLVDLMDAGTIGTCAFLCSTAFEVNEPEQCREMAADMAARGGRFLAVRNHAKVTVIDTTDDRHFVAEGSANLRTCRAIEQFTLTNDQAVAAFHRAWMEAVFARSTHEDRRAIGGTTETLHGRPGGRRRAAGRPRAG